MAQRVEMNGIDTSDSITKKVTRNEIQRLESELQNALYAKERIPVLIELKDQILEINKEAQLIQLKKYTKLTHEFEYEKDKRFTELMLRKQAILNQMDNMNKETEITDLKKTLVKLEEQIDYYTESIRLKKESIGE
jgi:hypothetical protein